MDDIIGKAGAEKVFESELRGTPELRKRVQVNNRGLAIGSSIARRAQPGHDVQLTVDIDAQQIAETSLQQGIDGARANGFPAGAGAVVVLDTRTGSIVALASNPTFDPNAFADGTAPDEWFDPNGTLPLFDRAERLRARFDVQDDHRGRAAPGTTPVRNADRPYYDTGCFDFREQRES